MKRSLEIIEDFKEFKTIPHVSVRLSQLLSKNDCSIGELETVIKYEPSLVLRLLRIVNSAHYGLLSKVESISDAIIYIGLESLKNVVIVDALKNIFKGCKSGDLFSPERLFLHSAVVAITAQMISERILGQKGDGAFLCGILHDTGMIVEYQVEEENFLKACLEFQTSKGSFTGYEKQYIGADHCEIAYQLAKDWELPQPVLEPVKKHHSNLDKVDPESLQGILVISEFMTARLSYTEIESYEIELPSVCSEYINDNIWEFKELANVLPDAIMNAKELYRLGGDE